MRLFGAVLLTLALFASACGSEEAVVLEGLAAEIYDGECVDAGDTTLTVFSGRTENLVEPIFEAFTCETGVELAVRYGDSTELALLLAEEGERNEVDVFLSRSPGPVGFLEAEGLLGSLSSDTLDLVDDQYESTTDTWVGFSGRKRVLVYNVDEIDEADLPQSVFDLTDERFRGQVAIPATNGSFIDWFSVFRAEAGDDVASQWLNDMVANDAVRYDNNRSIVEAASRGEILMGLVNHYYNYQEAIALGDDHRAANFDMAADDIGGLLIVTAASVVEGSELAEEGNELIQYLLTPEVQGYITNETFEYPLAADVDPNPDLAPLNSLEAGSIDFDALGGDFQRTTEIIEASGILTR